MIDARPPYYGSWKGRVLEAIAVENIRDWNDILDYTQLTRETLNTAISELYTLDLIERKDDGLYWIKNIDVYRQYRSYFGNTEIQGSSNSASRAERGYFRKSPSER